MSRSTAADLYTAVDAVIGMQHRTAEDVFAVALFLLLEAAQQIGMNDVELSTAVTRGRNEYNSTISQHDQGVN
ncbi:MAG: hypothetical protein E6Q97_38940 [Desulfurellales bacterium]|nr:MAG: hypothetical protein E6Q97_38940 [Desulfurellales bacterium]